MSTRFIAIIIFFLLFAGVMPVNAQAPGYMGKRWTAAYGLFLSPSFSRSTPNEGWFNAKHDFSLGWCLSARWQIQGSLQTYKTIYNNRLIVSEFGTAPENFYRISGIGGALLFKKFKRTYLAPWGKYFVMGPVFTKVQAEYDKYMYNRVRIANYDTLISNYGPNTQSFVDLDFVIGWGQSRVYKNHILIDYGMQFQLRSAGATIVGSTAELLWRLDQDDYIARTSALRVRRMNFFNVFIRLGYLF